MARLTRAQILGTDRREIEVDIPELGGSILLRAVTVAVRDKLNADYLAEKSFDWHGFNRAFVQASVVDPELDLDEVGNLSVTAFAVLLDAATDLNNHAAKETDAETGEEKVADPVEAATATFPAREPERVGA